MSHTYTYDGLYRLATATGTYTGADNKSASYTLAMGYDNMHRITSKSQHLTQGNVQFNGTLNVGYDLTYTYGSEAGKKFQLESVKDVNYRTEETPEGQQIENGHVYTYDKNGNLVYVNTNRVMTDGHRDNSVGERKLIWDEENRLLAVDDNGFVSNYWYDADGERTVKTSGESDQVYVNGVFSGGSTNTAKFSLYVSPYLVANQGDRYTKHIYAGSQRIVSKVGDFASYGSDPRRIEYAGANTDGLSVDYKSKYAAQQQVIKDNYKFFDVPYNGTDNDNYADGEGFCCNDGSMEAAVAQARKAQTRAVSRSFKDPDNYENLQFFYHPDHLGSSSFITNLEGEVVQHIEYVPFGEVFIEERNNVWNTPYLFNAKEFDEETGMYYYGARYYDPRLSFWMSTDPLMEINPNIHSYSFVINNPVNLTDPTGTHWVRNDKTNNYVWMDNVTSIENTPIGYSYVGASPDDILRSLNINFSTRSKELKKVGVGIGGDENRGGAPIGTMSKVNVYVTFTAEMGRCKPTKNNILGITFAGVSITGILNQQQLSPNSDYNLDYKGHLSVSFDGNWQSAVLRNPVGKIFNRKGWISREAKLFFPASELAARKVFGKVRITAGAPNANVLIQSRPIDVSWSILANPIFIQGKK